MSQPTRFHVYLGSGASGESGGIYHAILDTKEASLSQPERAAALAGSTFFCARSDGRVLYTNGRDDPETATRGAAVTALAVNRETGDLTPLGSQRLDGISFCHISLDRTERVLLGADYGSAAVVTFPLQADGTPKRPVSILQHQGFSGTVADRQDAAHVHSINVDSRNRFAYVCDFSADEITTYRLDPVRAELLLDGVATTTAGAGPRHLAVHPNLDLLYVINELAGSITVFRTRDGVLSTLQTISTLPEDFSADNTAAEIRLSPDRRFLYGTNRGHETIAHFRVDAATGRLSFVDWTSTGGEHPRNFAIDPTGKYMVVSNRNTNNVVVFALDAETGAPIPTGQELSLPVAMGVHIVDPG